MENFISLNEKILKASLEPNEIYLFELDKNNTALNLTHKVIKINENNNIKEWDSKILIWKSIDYNLAIGKLSKLNKERFEEEAQKLKKTIRWFSE